MLRNFFQLWPFLLIISSLPSQKKIQTATSYNFRYLYIAYFRKKVVLSFKASKTRTFLKHSIPKIMETSPQIFLFFGIHLLFEGLVLVFYSLMGMHRQNRNSFFVVLLIRIVRLYILAKIMVVVVIVAVGLGPKTMTFKQLLTTLGPKKSRT